MKSVFFAAALVAASGVAQAGTVFSDAENDLFDNGFSNLDIKSVTVSHDANNVYMSVETRGYQNWTKYMIYMNVSSASDFTGSNAWNRRLASGARQLQLATDQFGAEGTAAG